MIFLSYAPKDEDKAQILAKHLENNGFKVLTGGRYDNNCDTCVLLFSRETHKSIIARAGLGAAILNNNPVFILKIDGENNFNDLVVPVQTLDWFNSNNSKPLTKLVEEIRNLT